MEDIYILQLAIYKQSWSQQWLCSIAADRSANLFVVGNTFTSHLLASLSQGSWIWLFSEDTVVTLYHMSRNRRK
jgi:hypothetical protein